MVRSGSRRGHQCLPFVPESNPAGHFGFRSLFRTHFLEPESLALLWIEDALIVETTAYGRDIAFASAEPSTRNQS
jgi:hypothetical protein